MDSSDPVARRPRHEVQPGTACRLVLSNVETREAWGAQLADVSRQGLKAFTVLEIPDNAELDIQINLPSGWVKLAAAATVRWCKLQDDGQWAIGVSFANDLSWELMGELFLNGVLTLEVETSQRMSVTTSAR